MIEVDYGPNTKAVIAQAVLIPSFVRHRVKIHLKSALSLFFDPGFIIQNIEHEKRYVLPLTLNFNKSLIRSLDDKQSRIESLNEIFKSSALSAGFQLRAGTMPAVPDTRISTVLSEMNLNLMGCSFKSVLEITDLSASRFTHLFKDQTGMSFRSYLLWLKLRAAIELLSKKHNLTYAAHEAGFTDSAHFSRIFSRTFGFAPSFLKFTKIECVDKT